MTHQPVERSNNWRPSNGRPENPNERYPPRTPSPGPPPGQDYDTLTAKHGKPRGAFETNQSEASGCPRKEASK